MRRSLMTVLCLSFLSLGILVRGSAAQPAALTVTSTPPPGLIITSSTSDGSTTPYTIPSVAYGASVNLVAPATDPPGYTFVQWTVTAASPYPIGQKSITFTMMGFALTAVANYTASVAPAAKLAFVQGPTGATAGTAISPAVTVAVEDASGNVITTDTSNITLSLVQVSGSGTLNGGTQTMAAVSGVATFANLIISAAGTYQLQATDNSELPSETFNSASFTISGSAGGAAKLVYVQPPTGALAGATITPAVTIAVEDANGNVITTDSSSVTVFLGPSSTGKGTLGGTLTESAVNGIATFSDLSISAAGSYSLWAIDSDSSLIPATSDLFNIVFDTTPPIVFGEIPSPGGFAADGLTPIELQIVAASSGLNLSTVRIQAQRNLGTPETICDGSNLNPAAPASYPASIAGPYQGYYDATANGNTTFKGKTYIYGTTPQDTTFVFEPDTDAAYDFEETVNVAVTATDWAGNAMVFSFQTPPVSVYQFAVDTRSFGWDVQVDGGANGNNNPATATSTDANGNSIIWAVWERPDPVTQEGTIWLAQRTDDATNFGPEIQVTTVAANGNCHTPSIAITANGTIYVAYEVLTGIPVGLGPTSAVGLVSSTTAAPTTWNSFGLVTGTGAFTLNRSPAITFVNSTNTLYMAGVGLDPSSDVEEIGMATAVLTTPTTVPSWTITEVTTNAANQINPAIAQDANGVVYIVWTNLGSVASDIFGADSSTGWTTLNQVTNVGNAGFPTIATEASGNPLHFAWTTNGGMSNATIQYADTTNTGGGWPATAFTAGTSKNVLDGTSGIAYANSPRLAVVGSGATAHTLIVWQDERQSSVAGKTDIMFAEENKNLYVAFGTNVYLSLSAATLVGSLTTGAMVPALGVTADGEPYAVWTQQPLPLPNSGSHIFCSQAMYSRAVGPQPTPVVVTPAGGAWSFTDPLNPHITEIDISVPNDALTNTMLTLSASELRNPAQLISPTGANNIFADGSGVFFTLTGGVDELLNDWVTITITLPPGTTLPNPLAVYRLVPPSPSFTPANLFAVNYWTQADIQVVGVVTDPVTGAVKLTFQTLHSSSFGVALNFNDVGNAVSSAGGCSMSPGGEPDVFVLLLPLAALGIWAGTRLIGRKRSART